MGGGDALPHQAGQDADNKAKIRQSIGTQQDVVGSEVEGVENMAAAGTPGHAGFTPSPLNVKDPIQDEQI